MSNWQLSDAIQNLPPELREKILKALIATKIIERATLGWDKVNTTISKMPFCKYRQGLEWCCFSCYIRAGYPIHKPNLKEILKLENYIELMYFLRIRERCTLSYTDQQYVFC